MVRFGGRSAQLVWLNLVHISSLEEQPLMQAFNVYIQILVSQALEPGFLTAVTKEKGEHSSLHFKTTFNLRLYSG